MKRRGARVQHMIALEITPMIDVVFLLIVFFMTTAQFARVTRTELDLPLEQGEQEEQPEEAGFVVNINADGSIILAYPVTSTGTAVKDHTTAGTLELPRIPAGTYYISPGNFGHPIQLKLLDKIRAGELADLDAHNVPKVTAPGTVAFDVAQARDAILAAAGGSP